MTFTGSKPRRNGAAGPQPNGPQPGGPVPLARRSRGLRGLRPVLRFRIERRQLIRYFRRHRDDVSVLAALTFGLAAVTFSMLGTCNSRDQLAIQKYNALPQLAVNVRPAGPGGRGGEAIELVVTNNGGVINGLQIDCQSFIPMWIKLPRKRDTLVTFLPMENYFRSVTKTYEAQGVIARAAPAPSAVNAAYGSPRARGIYDDHDISVRAGRAHHVVHIAYDDVLGKRRDRFFMVSEMDSWEAPAGVSRRLADSLVARQATRRGFDLNRASAANVLRWARAIVPAGKNDRGLLSRLRVTP